MPEDNNKIKIGSVSPFKEKFKKLYSKLVQLSLVRKLIILAILILIITASIVFLFIYKKDKPMENQSEGLTGREAADSILEEAANRKQEWNNSQKTSEQYLKEYEESIEKAKKDNNKDALGSLYVYAAFSAKDAGNKQKSKLYAKEALSYLEALPEEAKQFSLGIINNLKAIINE